jgi:hypothetical protein
LNYLVMNTRRPLAPQLTVIFLAVAGGCTQSHDVTRAVDPDAGEHLDADRGPQDAPADNALCARFAALQCDAEQRCCSSKARSLERCESELVQSCTQSLYFDQIASDPKTALDPEAADRVLRELGERTVDCDPGVLQWLSSDRGLRGIFKGTLRAGESCYPPGGASGNAGVVAAALSSCRQADGLACLPKSLLGDWTCAPKQSTGQSCVTDDNCADNGACNNFSQPALGTCVERLPLGAACTQAAECESLDCEAEVCSEPSVDFVYCISS